MGARAETAIVQAKPSDQISVLSSASGLPLDAFRPPHVDERVRRALRAEGEPDAAALALRLRQDDAVRARFRASVAVSHSGLFRDAHQFTAIEERVVPNLLEHTERLRVWSAGCANGLELWSLAIVLRRLGVLERATLLGSDLLEENLAVARAGVYPDLEVGPELRARARWEVRDLTGDSPPGRFDLVLCRNVVIYLAPPAKARVHAMLAGALAPGGVLVLGRSERLSDSRALGLRRREPHIYERPR